MKYVWKIFSVSWIEFKRAQNLQKDRNLDNVKRLFATESVIKKEMYCTWEIFLARSSFLFQLKYS